MSLGRMIKMVTELRKKSMAIWKQTNELEHRTTTTILFAERERDVAVKVIKIVYEILQQIVLPQDE